MSPEWQSHINSQSVLADFDKASKEIGIVFAGTFPVYDSESTITNPIFAYDTKSRSDLLELIMYTSAAGDLPYWRTIDKINVELSDTEKNSLYDLLRYTYFTNLAVTNTAIDAL